MIPGTVVLDRFEVLEPLGGLLWRTFKGRDSVTGDVVEIRIVGARAGIDTYPPVQLGFAMSLPTLPNGGSWPTIDSWTRAALAHEARALGRCDHRGIQGVIAWSPEHGGVLVQEWLSGKAPSGPMSPECAALVVRQVADALAHANTRGVFHLYASPDSVRVDGGRVVVREFRWRTRIADDRPDAPTTAVLRCREGGWDWVDRVVINEAGDERAEVFCVAALLYELLTCVAPQLSLARLLPASWADPRACLNPRPSAGPGPRQNGDPVPGLFVECPASLAELVMRCLSLDRSRRPASCAEVRDTLDAMLADEGITDPAAELAARLGCARAA
jgi:serine/threonine protein kinase